MRVPRIGVPADLRQIGPHPFQAVGEKYLRALLDSGAGLPLCLPSLAPPLPPELLLEQVDGLLLPGSPSNIEPHHYGTESSYEGNLHDPQRDATTLPLIRAAVAAGVPILAICRGMQEVNVALGGTLHQKVHEVEGHHDHREDKAQPLEAQYGPAHAITLVPGGLLAGIAGSTEVRVNTLHGQGIRTLAPGLKIEATAPDGLIEAVALADPQHYLLAVQWHPEWKMRENPFYLGIFESFAQAVRQRAAGAEPKARS